MNDVSNILDRHLEHFARSGKGGVDLGGIDSRGPIATKGFEVELDGYELVDQGAQTRMGFRVAGFFRLFWHRSDPRSAVGA